jgi:hypothetical protein
MGSSVSLNPNMKAFDCPGVPSEFKYRSTSLTNFLQPKTNVEQIDPIRHNKIARNTPKQQDLTRAKDWLFFPRNNQMKIVSVKCESKNDSSIHHTGPQKNKKNYTKVKVFKQDEIKHKSSLLSRSLSSFIVGKI